MQPIYLCVCVCIHACAYVLQTDDDVFLNRVKNKRVSCSIWRDFTGAIVKMASSVTLLNAV